MKTIFILLLSFSKTILRKKHVLSLNGLYFYNMDNEHMPADSFSILIISCLYEVLILTAKSIMSYLL